MRGMHEQEPVTDTILEDYEDYLDEDDRWHTGGAPICADKRNGPLRKRGVFSKYG